MPEFCDLFCIKIGNIVCNIIYKIALNTVNNLKISAAFADFLHCFCGSRIGLYNAVVGYGNSLMSPIKRLVYDVSRRRKTRFRFIADGR